MNKYVIVVFAFLAIFFGFSSSALAQSPTPASEPTEFEIPAGDSIQNTVDVPQDEYSRAVVVSVTEQEGNATLGQGVVQAVKLRLVSGSETGKEMDVSHGDLFAITEEQKVKPGETVVVVKTQGPSGPVYYITDKYRTPAIGIIFAIFLGLAIFFGRTKGVRAVLGLLLSIGILIQYVIPLILDGNNPILVSFIGALVIAFLSLYLAHGVNMRTSVALASTIITLVLAATLSIIFVQLASLSGTGSEEAVFLRMGPIGAIDLKGLLLGGIIIGALGVLDDITIGQAASIEEIKKANNKLGRGELFKRGLSLGREHIASLINTLALAYAGASFPLLLLFSLGGNVPFWLTFNSEFIAEEVIRTLVGSTALVLAVPISTFLAAWVFSRNDNSTLAAVAAVTEPKATVRRTSARKTATRRTATSTRSNRRSS